MKFLLLFAACISFKVQAQSISSELQGLIKAENVFAQYARDNTTRDAFLKNLAEDGVVFSKGDAANGKEFWGKRLPNQSLLFWWPVFADISASGDFGYTTGPYEWSETKTGPPTAFGYYSTVWKKDTEGVWKVAIDLGINLTEPEKDKVPLTLGVAIPHKQITDITESFAHLRTIEIEYNQRLNTQGKSFDPAMLSTGFRIHRPSKPPFTSAKDILSISEPAAKLQFETFGGDFSRSGDMAYLYGQVKISSVNDSPSNEVRRNYLRVWRTTDGKNWKIVLDVIGN